MKLTREQILRMMDVGHEVELCDMALGYLDLRAASTRVLSAYAERRDKAAAEIEIVRQWIRAASGHESYPCSVAEIMRVIERWEWW